MHTFNSKLLLTMSPFYHYNAANYESAANDYPTATTTTFFGPMPVAR